RRIRTYRTDGWIEALVHGDLLGRRRGARRVEPTSEDGPRVWRLELEADLPGGDARDVEQVRTQPLEGQRGFLHARERMRDATLVNEPAPEHPRPGQDRPEGRAELVRQHGEELVA